MLFILLILSISIIFCHALVRICILVLNPLSDDEDGPNRPHRIPSMTGIEGYRPERPFQVHLVADVDNHISSLTTAELVGRESSERQQDSSKVVAAPPPAYGLWRNSVVRSGILRTRLLALDANNCLPVTASQSCTALLGTR